MEKIETKTIIITNIRDLYNFVAAAAHSKVGSEIYAKQGRAVIPCVSIMGMFSIDTSKPFCVEYPDTEDAADFGKFLSTFEVTK